MSSRRIALLIGTLVGLIAIVAWIAEIDLVFEESAEEQAPSQKSLVVEETSSREKAPANWIPGSFSADSIWKVRLQCFLIISPFQMFTPNCWSHVNDSLDVILLFRCFLGWGLCWYGSWVLSGQGLFNKFLWVNESLLSLWQSHFDWLVWRQLPGLRDSNTYFWNTGLGVGFLCEENQSNNQAPQAGSSRKPVTWTCCDQLVLLCCSTSW